MDAVKRRRLALALATLGWTSAQAGAGVAPAFKHEVEAVSFYKGNLHAHSAASDGDVPPADVAAWYRDHGYAFLALTDHDKLVDVSSLAARGFILLPGDELSSHSLAGGKRVPLHVNSLCGTAPGAGFTSTATVVEVMQATVDMARKGGALALLNHPNFGWALSEPQLVSVRGFELLEIASGHPGVNERGDSQHASEEALWDAYLTRRGEVWGAAVDDSHDFKPGGESRRPGRAWVEAWAPELTPQAVCAALRDGHFYSSRGSTLRRLSVGEAALALDVDGWDPATDAVEFIGSGGRLLARTSENPARYLLKGGEGYVRARVRQSGGREAWTQAYFTR
jgi:hypothetical protein